MWCCRVPGRACSPPRPTTPSSPSPSLVWFSTPWERPTSASLWTFTVSQSLLISPRSITCGPLHSLKVCSQRDKTHHCCVVFFFFSFFSLSSFSPLVLLHYYSNTTKNISHSLFLSPVGPILLVDSQPKTVDVDSDVTLNCKWAGNPPLTLTWFKKGSNMVRS